MRDLCRQNDFTHFLATFSIRRVSWFHEHVFDMGAHAGGALIRIKGGQREDLLFS
jgi:hypothetical protein